MTFLRHKALLTSELALVSSTKCRTIYDSLFNDKAHFPSISSRHQLPIEMIRSHRFLALTELQNNAYREALAVVYGLRFTRHFVLGCDNLVVATDHEPLLGVLNNRNLSDIKERLLSLKEKTLPLRISVIHIPGQKQKRQMETRRNPLVIQTNNTCIAISRIRTHRMY